MDNKEPAESRIFEDGTKIKKRVKKAPKKRASIKKAKLTPKEDTDALEESLDSISPCSPADALDDFFSEPDTNENIPDDLDKSNILGDLLKNNKILVSFGEEPYYREEGSANLTMRITLEGKPGDMVKFTEEIERMIHGN